MSKFFAHSAAKDINPGRNQGPSGSVNQSKTGNTTITSSGTVIRSNQDLANSRGYRDAIAEIRRIKGATGK